MEPVPYSNILRPGLGHHFRQHDHLHQGWYGCTQMAQTTCPAQSYPGVLSRHQPTTADHDPYRISPHEQYAAIFDGQSTGNQHTFSDSGALFDAWRQSPVRTREQSHVSLQSSSLAHARTSTLYTWQHPRFDATEESNNQHSGLFPRHSPSRRRQQSHSILLLYSPPFLSRPPLHMGALHGQSLIHTHSAQRQFTFRSGLLFKLGVAPTRVLEYRHLHCDLSTSLQSIMSRSVLLLLMDSLRKVDTLSTQSGSPTRNETPRCPCRQQ